MKYAKLLVCLIFLIGISSRVSASDTTITISDFKLRNVDGKYLILSDHKNAKGFVLVFMCNHCPMAKRYFSKLNTFNTKYASKGFPLLAINPMDSVMYEEESWENMVKVSKARNLNYPYLQDIDQTIAKSLKVTHTPQAFVVLKTGETWTVQYFGAIDNGEDEILNSWISKSVDNLLAKKPLETTHETSIGCAVYYRKKK